MLSLCIVHATAQPRISAVTEPDYNKPRLFADLPEILPVRIADLERLLPLPVGTVVKAKIGNDFILTGTVISKSDEQDTVVRSIVIKSANRPGATFTFTKTLKRDGTASYRGRMVSFKHSDAYELTPQNGAYVLQKKEDNDMITE
ncbi:MAG: hypothetical protein NVSMB7_17430 [Chitinophagaceae bacterium]